MGINFVVMLFPAIIATSIYLSLKKEKSIIKIVLNTGIFTFIINIINLLIVNVRGNTKILSLNEFNIHIHKGTFLIKYMILSFVLSCILPYGIFKIMEKIDQSKRQKIKNISLYIVINFLCVFFIEFLQRGSISKVIEFIDENLIAYMVNCLLIFIVTSISFLFKSKRFVYSIIIITLIILGGANRYIWNFRGTPLTTADMYCVKDGMSIMDQYVNMKFIIGICSIILFMIILSILVWKLDKKHRNKKIKRLSNLIKIIVPLAVVSFIGINISVKGGDMETILWDLNASYMQNGFLYSFVNTASGLQNIKPSNYNKEEIALIAEKISDNENVDNSNNKTPNIIIMQLESVFDPYRLNNVEFNEDPMSNIRELLNENSSGALTVPTYGGGTVKTEFEVLTGLAISNLKVGTIPNNDILKKQSVESIAYGLKDNGYNTSVLHNFYGSFYNRNQTFGNMGFENFVPFEYMENSVEDYYPRDVINMKPIEQLLESEKPQFIYNITVETHGAYNNYEYDGYNFQTDGNVDKESKDELQCYINRLKNTDAYVRELVDYLEELNEPTIVVGFSDHLPSLKLIDNGEGLEDGNMYNTEYFMWDNMGLDKKNKDLKAYQLSSYVLDKLGIDGGNIAKLHNTYMDNEEYDNKLKLLQYDILFGKQYIYGGNNPYEKTSLQLGLDQVVIKNAYVENGVLKIEGENFTDASKVFVDGKEIETVFNGSDSLESKEFPEKIKKIKIGQVSLNNKALSYSEEYYIK